MQRVRQFEARRLGRSAAIALVTTLAPVAAAEAQDSTISRIEAIERQIGGVQSELRRLKSELGETNQQPRQSRSEAQRAQNGLRDARGAAARTHRGALSFATAPSQAAKPEASTQTASPQPAVGAPAESAGVKLSMPEGRPTIATADGRASLAICRVVPVR